MKNDEYVRLLRHPHWQEMRLRVMERARFECENCGTSDENLQVHHRYYERGKKPWDYPEETMECLCERCHRQAQDVEIELRRAIGLLSLCDKAMVMGFIYNLIDPDVGFHPNVTIRLAPVELAEGIEKGTHRVSDERISRRIEFLTKSEDKERQV